MKTTEVIPTGVERMLDPDDLIVSKTDAKGVLTYVNSAFCRLAAADEADLLGRPHNVVRHPEMPRALFKYMWESIGARQEVFAYVKNLGLDGTHYWVFAHVTASGRAGGPPTGYHSNRRCPARKAIAAIEPLYRQLRDIERSTSGSREALDASVAALHETLAARGTTYDEYIWSITP